MCRFLAPDGCHVLLVVICLGMSREWCRGAIVLRFLLHLRPPPDAQYTILCHFQQQPTHNPKPFILASLSVEEIVRNGSRCIVLGPLLLQLGQFCPNSGQW